MTYILHAAVSYDTMLLKQEINVYMKMRKSMTNVDGLSTAEPVKVSDIRTNKQNFDILQNSYMFMKNIRGTVAYFRNSLYDLLAMFKTIGPPTLFMTLSADDLHWPELGMMLENISYEEALKKGSFVSSMRNDPLITAIHFERRFSALLKFVILGKERPLGNVVDHFVRVEFQNRGSPHYHLFLWVENIPSSIDSANRESICMYVNQTIKTEIPLQNEDEELYHLVTRLQSHSHTKYCMPSSRPPCRFGFPKHACSSTRLLDRYNSSKNKGKFYETKRSSDAKFINAYNPVILRHWRANMDIQVINNADGAAYYVCHYLCKSEPDELRGALTNLIYSVFKDNPSMSAFQRLWNIGTCVLKHRRMSAQEAAYRLSNLKLIQISREIVYLNTRRITKRFKMLKPERELQELSDDSTNIFMNNILDYYCARLVHMDSTSLYYFASWFLRCTPPPNQSMVSLHTSALERIYISGPNIWMRKRSRPAVVRYPSFSLMSDDYYYSLLMLLLPHRDESDLLLTFETAKDAFFHQYSHLNLSAQTHEHFVQQVENGIRRIRLAEAELQFQQPDVPMDKPMYQSCAIQSNFSTNQQSPLQCELVHEIIDSTEDEHHYHQIQACCMSATEFHASCMQLTSCQAKVMDYIQSFFCAPQTNAMHLFITGGAGVGKSYLLKLVVAYLQLNTAILTGVSPVKLCAPTGTAAHNINGFTIHYLLRIPVDSFLNYGSLTAYQIQRLRIAFSGVHTIIIDEISMVSDKMLMYISRRLSEISEKTLPFGGFHIIVVGDFFQLRPVRGTYAFNNKLLWDLFLPIFLRTNVRQQGDTAYSSLLNRARVGMLLPADIVALKSRLNISPDSSESPGLCIYATRAKVHDKNILCEQTLLSSRYIINAEHYFSQKDQFPGGVVSDALIPDDDRDAGNLPRMLHIRTGSRVMLIRNICTAIGLVNGAIGTVFSVQVDVASSLVSTINILFDDRSVGVNREHSAVPVQHTAIAINTIEHLYIMNGRNIVRRAFPLNLCWASTVHKVQGMSLPAASIDLGSSVFQHGMAYVALSRVQTLNRLTLLAFNPAVVTPCDTVLLEYERLRDKQL